MQQLKFEPSWEKALPIQDRIKIEQTFKQIDHESISHKSTFTPLWQARNYRGELLVTVIVNNYSDEELVFDQTPIQYVENNQVLATHSFTLKTLTIPAKTSMPWAFIFPKEKLEHKAGIEHGVLNWA